MTAVLPPSAAPTERLVVRSRPTAYDAPSREVTVATPSCCCSCSCCCCAVTVSTTIAFTAAAGWWRHASVMTGRSFAGATLAGLSLPVALATVAALGQNDSSLGLWVAPVIFLAMLAGGLVLTGLDGFRAATLAIVTLVVFCGAAFAEVFLALATVFLFELLVPVGVVFGVRWGKRASGVPLAVEGDQVLDASAVEVDLPVVPDDPDDGAIWPPGTT